MSSTSINNDFNGASWLAVGLSMALIIAYAVSFQGIPPVMPWLIEELNISYAQAGGLIGLFTIPGLVVSMVCGRWINRTGSKKMGFVALLVLALGAFLVAAAQSYWQLALGRFIGGAGGAALLVVGPRLIADWVPLHRTGFAMGIYNTAMPIGTIITLNGFGWAIPVLGWSQTLMSAPVVALLIAVVFVGLCRDKAPRESVSTLDVESVSGGKRWLPWVMALLVAIHAGGAVQYYTFAPDYFITQGLTSVEATWLAALPMWPPLLLTPVVGLILDRFGHHLWFIGVACVLIAVSVWWLPLWPEQTTLLVLLFGVTLSFIVPTLFALPPLWLPPAQLGWCYGLLTSGYAVGVFIGAWLLGAVRDASGGYTQVFHGMAVFALMALIPLFAMVLMRRDVEQV